LQYIANISTAMEYFIDNILLPLWDVLIMPQASVCLLIRVIFFVDD
jgi:hypothetical protein